MILLFVSGCASNVTDVPPDARRDAERYAIASCLFYQNQPYLKDQGDAWAGAIVQRTQLDVDALSGIAEAIKQERAKGDMAVGRSESGGPREKALPILYCGEIADRPSIRRAIERVFAAPGR